MKVLMDYEWPGNVRELENVIERAVVLSPGKSIAAELFPKNIAVAIEDNISLKERVGNFEKTIILAALEKTGWNQKKAAQLLSVNATTLSEKLKRLRIKNRGAQEPLEGENELKGAELKD
jgi:DNA-binding NtrC family response regulator